MKSLKINAVKKNESHTIFKKQNSISNTVARLK